LARRRPLQTTIFLPFDFGKALLRIAGHARELDYANPIDGPLVNQVADHLMAAGKAIVRSW
jgi:hypothetical protein